MNIKLKYLILCSIALLNINCFSYMVDSIGSRSSHRTPVPVITDEIIAIGKFDNKKFNQSKMGDTVVFLGENHSYVLADGAQEISDLIETSRPLKIHIRLGSNQLFSKNKNIWGHIQIICENLYNYPEYDNILIKAGFTPEKAGSVVGAKHYAKNVRITGEILPKIVVSDKFKGTLKSKYQIKAYQPAKSATIPKIAKTVLMPIAGVADVVTSPLQLAIWILVGDSPH